MLVQGLWFSLQRSLNVAKPGKRKRAQLRRRRELEAEPFKAEWDRKCEVCGASPVVAETGMCGPCTFGEADTAGGNW